MINETTERYLASKSKNYAVSSIESCSSEEDNFKIFLNLGESLLGPTPKAEEQLKKLSLEDLLEYPEDSVVELKKAIADFYNTSPGQVVLGTGSDTIIETIPRIFARPGGISLATAPEFFRFKDAHMRTGSDFYLMERDEEDFFGFTETVRNGLKDKIEKARPDVVWISNPNNPTGNAADMGFIKDILKAANKADSLFVVDEAYGEFNDYHDKPFTAAELINEGAENLIVLRTFSKGYGLAGIRVGYGMISGNLEKSGVFSEWTLPYDVNNIGAKIAPLALEDQKHLEWMRGETGSRKSLIENSIEKNPNLSYIPGSVTNTLLARIEDGRKLSRELALRGIKVCDQDGYEGTLDKGYSRITVGSPEDTESLCRVLEGL